MNKTLRILFSTVQVNSYARLFVLLFCFSSLLYSCKSRQKITLNNGKCILDFKNARTLTTNLKAKEFHLDKLKAKLTVDAVVDSADYSFSVALRMKKDSVIWMSLSKLGIEGARVMITKDSVKFINTLKNTYFKGDYAYISKLLNTELDFEMLQSLLIGNSVSFYDEDEKIKPGVDDCMYTLGTIRKFKMRKVEKGRELKEPAQRIYMKPLMFKVARIVFYEFNPDRSFDARFDNFQVLESDGQLFPMTMKYIIKAQKNVNIDINYSKVTLNEELSFPFKIPDNYEQIIVNKK
jgi:hypothetical protein